MVLFLIMIPIAMDQKSGRSWLLSCNKGLCLLFSCSYGLILQLMGNCIPSFSLEGPFQDLIIKQMDRARSENSSLGLKCLKFENELNLRNKQLEDAMQQKSEYLKRYEDAMSGKKKAADDYMSRIANLQSKCSSLEERCSSMSKTLDSTRHESVEWKRKYEQLLAKQKAEDEQANADISLHKSRTAAAEARLAAAQEQVKAAQEEAEEWKRKFDSACRQAKDALEKAAAVQDRTNMQTQQREDTLRAEFGTLLSEKVQCAIFSVFVDLYASEC